LIVVSDGTLEVTLEIVRPTALGVAENIVRVDLDGLVEVSDGTVVGPLVAPSEARGWSKPRGFGGRGGWPY